MWDVMVEADSIVALKKEWKMFREDRICRA